MLFRRLSLFFYVLGIVIEQIIVYFSRGFSCMIVLFIVEEVYLHLYKANKSGYLVLQCTSRGKRTMLSLDVN